MSRTIAQDELETENQPGVLPVLQSKRETKAFYNKIARVYDLLAERSEQPMRAAGLDMLDVQPGEHVLEIGFGTGHTLVKLAKAAGPDGRVYGLDLADKMVDVARQLVTKEELADRVQLMCGDAEELPYAANALDGVIMIFTLELFDTPDIPRVLDECKRVLRPGGRIVVVSISKEGEQGLLVRAFEWTHRHFPNLMDCRPVFVRRALESAGFEIEDAKVDHMWVPVEIVLASKP
jgi:demethylmenaquinone methyltransferase/2-methoxy-6-polyprenyl-1,4-benzoquinol methylase